MEIAETFRFVEGHNNRYLISDVGNVKSISIVIMRGNGKKYTIKGTTLKGELNNCGYKRVYLYSHKKKDRKYVHRLVAETFIPNPENKPQINHKNGIKIDNNVANLEWVTAKENCNHASIIGLYPRGNKHKGAKLSNDDILFIRKYKKGYYFNEKDEAKRVTFRWLADILGVSRSAIYAAYKGKTWTHI